MMLKLMLEAWIPLQRFNVKTFPGNHGGFMVVLWWFYGIFIGFSGKIHSLRGSDPIHWRQNHGFWINGYNRSSCQWS
jgi:hypothetical protein